MKKFVFVLLFVFLLFSGCLIQPQVTIKSLEQKGEKALVELRANKEFNAEVKITDEEGETLCSDKIELKQGNNLIEINCNLTEKKVYVEILSDGAVFSRYFDLTLADDIISDVLDTDLIIDPLRDNITEIINVDYIVKEIIPIEKIPVGLRPVKPIEVEIHPKENVSGCNWYPNPNSYPEYYDESNKIHTATVLHRTTKECGTDKVVKSEEVIKLTDSKGNKLYCNYLCRNRYKEQCILDGSFDKYYDEWCEYEDAFEPSDSAEEPMLPEEESTQ